MNHDNRHWRGKNVLITGVCNSIGQTFLETLRKRPVARIVGLGNRRSDLFYLGERFGGEKRLRLFYGDVRDRAFLQERLAGIDIVINAPAFDRKSLNKFGIDGLMEAFRTGSALVVETARALGVSRLLLATAEVAASGDAAIAQSLREAEQSNCAGAQRAADADFAYLSVRLGNILDRPGALFPQFERQIASGGPVVLPGKDTTGFATTLRQAVERSLTWLFLTRDGDVFVNRAPAFRHRDLAAVMIAALAPLHGQDSDEIEILDHPLPDPVLAREELMSAAERAVALEDAQFYLLRASEPQAKAAAAVKQGMPRRTEPLRSDLVTPLNPTSLRDFLIRQKLLPEPGFSFQLAEDLRVFP